MSSGAGPDPLARSIGLAAFATWSRTALEPFGFTRENTLTLVAVCRDELMFATGHALFEQWGAAFDLTSLGALVFVGRSGMTAAAGHAPGIDGRRRFVAFVLPHVGVGADGTAGVVDRFGIDETSTACGALIELRRQLGAGPVAVGLDPQDVEMSLIRGALMPHLGTELPSIVELTELARERATAEVVRLSDELRVTPETDIAVISGIVMHRPDGDGVVVRDAWVTLGSDPTRKDLPHV